MTEQRILNPADVENRIREIANMIAESVDACSRTYAAYLSADHAYDVAVATSYFGSSGSVEARKMQIHLDCQAERKALNLADVAYRYADRRAKALESELRAYQSVGASVRSQWGVVGTTERDR